MSIDVDALFDAMRTLYGNRWTSSQGEFDERGDWTRELRGHTDQAIQRGLMLCREQVREAARQSDSAWPPQAAEFAAMCEPAPSDYGLPSDESAWLEVSNHCGAPERHNWSHAAVRLAGRAVGFWEIERTTAISTRASLEKRFKRQYAALVNRVMQGETLVVQGLLESQRDESAPVAASRRYEERVQQQASRFAGCGTGAAAINNLRNLVRGIA